MKAPKLAVGKARTGLQRDASGEETEAPFLMGLIVDSIVTESPRAKVTTGNNTLFREGTELHGSGVRHVLKVGGNGFVLASFADGQPALVQVSIQKGRIDYLAIPLVPRARWRSWRQC